MSKHIAYRKKCLEGVYILKVKYDIADCFLIQNLNNHYGIIAEKISFIPMGDSAYSYRVDCNNGNCYYLKLFDEKNDRQRRGIERLEYYLSLTWNLYHQGLIKNITYPIKNLNRDYKTKINDLTLVLFNFIEGKTLAESYPFSKEILVKISQSMAAIHQITHYIEPFHMVRETFDISFTNNLEHCISVLEGTHISDNHIISVLREKVLGKKDLIYCLLDNVRNLLEFVKKDKQDWVLCHGDLWGGNMIISSNELYLIDWESAIVAPREYDIVGYVGKDFGSFFSSYKKFLSQDVSINIELLRFYSYRHHLRNLTNWLMNILYQNTDEAQSENDLEMILYHCLNRFENIEDNLKEAKMFLNEN